MALQTHAAVIDTGNSPPRRTRERKPEAISGGFRWNDYTSPVCCSVSSTTSILPANNRKWVALGT